MEQIESEQNRGLRTWLTAGWRPYLLLALVIAVLYGQTLFFQLTLHDDHTWIVERRPFLSDWGNLPRALKMDALLNAKPQFYYRPVYVLIMMLQAHFFGGWLPGYHLSAIVFHIGTCLLLFALLRKAQYGDRSFLLASLFAVHPALTQAVAWTSGPVESSTAVLILGSVLLFAEYLESERTVFAFGHLLMFGLALLTKEVAACVPVICVLYGLLIGCKRPSRRGIWVLALGWSAVGLSWFTLYSWIFRDNAGYYQAGNMLGSIWSNVPALLPQFGKMLLPFRLCTFQTLQDAVPWYGIIGLILLAAALWRSPSRSMRAVVFGLCWAVMFMVATLVHPRSLAPYMVAEYRLYLPLAGLLFVLAEVDWIRFWDAGRSRHFVGLAVVGALLCVLTLRHSRDYKDSISHWTNAVRYSPHSGFCHQLLGTSYQLKGDPQRAEPEYLLALQYDPGRTIVRNNLGVILMDRGQLPEAEKLFREELSLNRDYIDAWTNLGRVALAQGHYRDAIAVFAQTLELSQDPKIFAYLAVAYQSLPDLPKAKVFAQEYLRRGGSLPGPFLASLGLTP